MRLKRLVDTIHNTWPPDASTGATVVGIWEIDDEGVAGGFVAVDGRFDAEDAGCDLAPGIIYDTLELAVERARRYAGETSVQRYLAQRQKLLEDLTPNMEEMQ